MEMSGQFHAPEALLPEKNSGTRCVGGLVGPDVMENGKFSCPAQLLCRPARSVFVIPTDLSWLITSEGKRQSCAWRQILKHCAIKTYGGVDV
jgi:hypothetical protein